MKKLTRGILGLIIGPVAFVVYLFLMFWFGLIAGGALFLDAMGWRKIKTYTNAAV